MKDIKSILFEIAKNNGKSKDFPMGKVYDPDAKDPNSMEWDPLNKDGTKKPLNGFEYKKWIESQKKPKPDVSESLLKKLAIPAAIIAGGALAIPAAKTMVSAIKGTNVVAPTGQTPIVKTETQKPKAQTAPIVTAATSETPEHFKNDNIRRFYAGIVNAEHRGSAKKLGLATDAFQHHADLYVRTKGDSASSAYGPAQLTRNTVMDHVKRHPDLFKGQESYAKQFTDQGTSMLKSTRMHPTFGGGKAGTLSGTEHHENYQRLATGVMRSMAQDIGVDLEKPMSDDDHYRLTKRWRGVGQKEDPAYYTAHNGAYSTTK